MREEREQRPLTPAEDSCLAVICDLWNRELNMSIRIYDKDGNVRSRAGGLSFTDLRDWYIRDFARAPVAEFINDRTHVFHRGRLQKTP